MYLAVWDQYPDQVLVIYARGYFYAFDLDAIIMAGVGVLTIDVGQHGMVACWPAMDGPELERYLIRLLCKGWEIAIVEEVQ